MSIDASFVGRSLKRTEPLNKEIIRSVEAMMKFLTHREMDIVLISSIGQSPLPLTLRSRLFAMLVYLNAFPDGTTTEVNDGEI